MWEIEVYLYLELIKWKLYNYVKWSVRIYNFFLFYERLNDFDENIVNGMF